MTAEPRRPSRLPHCSGPARRPPRWRDERGIAALELAATLPVLLMLLWGVIGYGALFAVEHTVNGATAEAARDAVSARDVATAESVAATRAMEGLSLLGDRVDPSMVATAVAPCPGLAGVQCITVHVSVPYADAPLVPPLFGLPMPAVVDATSTVQLSL